MNLKKIEYEGLASLMTRLLQSNELNNNLSFHTTEEIRRILVYTENGFILKGNTIGLMDFVIDGIFLQNEIPILTARDTRLEFQGISQTVYVDMTDFLDTPEFDVDLFIWKLYKAVS